MLGTVFMIPDGQMPLPLPDCVPQQPFGHDEALHTHAPLLLQAVPDV